MHACILSIWVAGPCLSPQAFATGKLQLFYHQTARASLSLRHRPLSILEFPKKSVLTSKYDFFEPKHLSSVKFRSVKELDLKTRHMNFLELSLMGCRWMVVTFYIQVKATPWWIQCLRSGFLDFELSRDTVLAVWRTPS